jgi:RNA exonuclease 4
MVGIQAHHGGEESAVARVSIVNYFGHVLLDAYIKPTQRVVDFRTKYSGIRPADILNSSGILYISLT